MATHDPSLGVCVVCHTRITQLRPSGLWIHARSPRPWHIAQPSAATAARIAASTETRRA